ncbi:hypothetical protein pb186bvf_014846 [Paramecium bursaria]
MNFILQPIRTLYPLFQSLKFLKKKDKEGQKKVLKYWCTSWILSLADIVLPVILNEYLTPIIVLVFSLAFVLQEFRLATYLFDNVVHVFIQKNESQIKSFFELIHNQANSLWDKVYRGGRQQMQKEVVNVVYDQMRRQD